MSSFSLMRKKFVEDHHWIDEDEMLDLVVIGRVHQGLLRSMGRLYAGYKMAGPLGIFISVLATIIPPL